MRRRIVRTATAGAVLFAMVTLPACGISYPGGYDPNTVGVVEGRVAAISRPETIAATIPSPRPANTGAIPWRRTIVRNRDTGAPTAISHAVVPASAHAAARPPALDETAPRWCPVCRTGSESFLGFGVTPRGDARCPHCQSRNVRILARFRPGEHGPP